MRRWVILALLLAVALAAVWWFFFIKPREERIDQLARRDYQAAVDEGTRLSAQKAELEAIRDAEVEYLAGIGKLGALIPERPLLDQFIDDLYELCGRTGVELLNLAPALPVPMTESTLRQITVAVTIDGEFFEVLDFLYGIVKAEDMNRLVRVDTIAVSSSQDEAGVTFLTVSLSLRLFTLADLVPAATTPSDTGTTPGEESTGGDVPPEALTTTVPPAIPSTTVPGGGG